MDADFPSRLRSAANDVRQAKNIEGVPLAMEFAAFEIDELRAALIEIRDMHLGDQPAESGSELDFAKAHIMKLRRIAYAALGPKQ